MHRIPISLYLLFIASLTFANISVYRELFAPAVLMVRVLDVGERGFSVLVRTPNHKTVLIDTGPDAGILRALGEALPIWQRHIGGLILTSTKKTFAGGAPDVARRYRIDKTFSSGTRFVLDSTISINILAPDSLRISYGSTSLHISSSTPHDAYVSNGTTITHD